MSEEINILVQLNAYLDAYRVGRDIMQHQLLSDEAKTNALFHNQLNFLIREYNTAIEGTKKRIKWEEEKL